ncbi:carbohydrate ABC transporter permease [Kineothrix sp. MB12-C1]|uniref:carbohydrate ABC transporter permease n=1 Tax=Kineothrix sp. MB12-C1 TaxID=3070215 RepID=UPI0027D2FB0C|nr:sugar ABC transporter permease [Kineothrix sp. MB12-C1]WMC91847.1 sugar ABC transporter permease [Kineothrix sp. MB12-C1]
MSSTQQKNKGITSKVAERLRSSGRTIAGGFSNLRNALVKGSWKTKLTFLIMGFGNIAHGQIIKGLLFLAAQISFFYYFFGFGYQYIQHIDTLGENQFYRVWDEASQIYRNTPGDNSLAILLYSILTIFLVILLIVLYISSINSAYQTEQRVKSGREALSFKEELKSFLNQRLHITMLFLPALGVMAFTVIPVVFMICLAFTNFDRFHQSPGNLFTWIGLENFKDIFWQSPVKSRTFSGILGWTLIWAVCSTFLNYIFGMIVALMINKKGIRFKSVFRTCFVISIAVPGFVTLLFMRQILADQGVLNVILMDVLNLTNTPIKFLSTPTLARISVIVVNLWVGIPHTMLITSGILMNIPRDLYESAEIDGAGPVKQFIKITLPYMLFITTPYLITQFIGNINNFNAIFFLTRGEPLSLNYYQAGSTDLLITWLYKLTVDFQDYNLASTIGIFAFAICAGISLITFNITSSAKKEDVFQ